MVVSYQTLLDLEDIQELLRGKVLFREADGRKSNPPVGNSMERTHPMEIAINDTALEQIRQYLIEPLREAIAETAVRPKPSIEG